MRPGSLREHIAALRSAVEANDFLQAARILRDCGIGLRSEGATMEEMHFLRETLEWSLTTTRSHKTHISAELMALKTLINAYSSELHVHTWRIEG